MVSFASSTRTLRPARASAMAAASPFGPEPTTTASSWVMAVKCYTELAPERGPCGTDTLVCAAARLALLSHAARMQKHRQECLCHMAPRSNYTAREMPTLNDESPQGRRVAAIALGKRGGAGAVAALREALAREELGWVRSSMILALGKLGGDEAREVLASIAPKSDAEAEALRKARDRVSGPATGFAWRGDAAVFASAPVGLEDVAIGEAGGGALVRRGTIALPSRPRGLRCIYDVRMLIAEGKAGAFAETVKSAVVPWRDWIASDSDALPYRFSLENARVAKQEFNDLLRAARETFGPQGLVDSPSSYAAMLRVEADPDATRIWLVPTFEPDVRFAYRTADVGASINPVVGACLARL